ncbi:hypothetical protein B7435_13205 [Mycolicibacterium peregrinum]|uniref:helix-turn-helix domain-containing protein n=1 Tax=Mycolicibacterium peregrinum TaxID=43304 RepID=UPI0007EA7F5C|nr:helix-turn-helix domain-containing protein [Mycolicibacterium peregrinum]OBB31260.1 hypothetical protein A5763_12610 [Mycolicibacterium fortuitum]OWM02841.1 hypothetical protein B7435_13205 [Mycolicibacterium peregrinum]
MTKPTTTPPSSETEILTECTELLSSRLPDAWRVDVQRSPADAGIDAVLALTAPSGEQVRFVVEAKRLLVGRDIPRVSEQLQWAADRELSNTKTMVMSRYLAPPIRERLLESDMSFIDATGNILVQSSRPALYVRDRGADKDPWRSPGRPRGSLAGEPAARVVRALIAGRGPWSARDLVSASGASTGATYRVLEFLQEEGLVQKAGTEYVLGDWPKLLRRWSRDYSFFRNNRTSSYIEPRGLETLQSKAANSQYSQYAITGTIAAAQWAPYAPARAAMVYVDDAVRAAKEWGLRPAEKGANVILAEPKYDVVFSGSSTNRNGAVIVAIEQAAVDLLTGPGRNPSEGEELISWMERNESEWRRG